MKKQSELEPKFDRWSYLWLALALLLGLFGFGKWLIPVTAWFAGLLALRFLRTQRVARGWLIWVVLSIPVATVAAAGVVPFPLPMTIGFMALQTLLGSLPFLADRLLAPRLRGFASTLVFPLAVTAWEFINLTTSPMGSFGSQAYTQYGNLALMQLASITGIWGITFLLSWFATVGNWVWEEATANNHTPVQTSLWTRVGRGVTTYAVIVGLVLVYGNSRLLLATPNSASVRIAGVTIGEETLAEILPLYEQDRARFRQITQARHAAYLAATVREAQAGAQIVLWPEGAAFGVEEDVTALVVRSQELARQEGIYLAVQLFQFMADPQRLPENKLLLVQPDGTIGFAHVKYGGNFLEGTLLGDGILRTIETPFGRLSGVICWDADFVGNIRQAGQQGVDLLLIGANDWREVGEIHAQMAVFRAIENGVTIARQAANGISQAVDPYGRVLASLDHYRSNERTLVAQLPAQMHRFTLYSVIGDSFGWATLIGLVLLAGWALLSGRRMGAEQEMLVEQSQAT